MADPLATPDDVAARWRDLDAAETARATTLIGDASIILRRNVAALDDRITDGTLDAAAVTMVIAKMVKRALTGPDDGVTQEIVGPFQRSYANPNGDVYATASELALLSPLPARAGVGTIRLNSGYPRP